MTILEEFLIAFIWIIIGCFICYKRKWNINDDPYFSCTMMIILAPLFLIITFFKVYIIDEWKN